MLKLQYFAKCVRLSPFLDRLPFNWKTPFGYFCAFLLACIVTYAILYTILPVICIGIGTCVLMVPFLKDALNNFHISDDKNGTEIKKIFYSVVEDFLDLKQLSEFCVHTPSFFRINASIIVNLI